MSLNTTRARTMLPTAPELDPVPRMSGDHHDFYHLVYRTAQLEAELKSIKDKLIEANNVNQYLLHRMISISAPSVPRDNVKSIDNDGPQSLPAQEQELARNSDTVHQRQAYAKLKQLRDKVTYRDSADVGLKRLRVKHRCLLDSSDMSEDLEGDLLGLDYTDDDPAYTYARAFAQSTTTAGPRTEVIPRNIENSIGMPFNPFTAHAERQAATELLATSNPRTRTSRATFDQPALPFVEHEISRLKGAACFIESMEPEQYEQHWPALARMYPRHTALEWRSVYECEVRPPYRQTHGERIDAKTNIDKGDEVGEDQANVVNDRKAEIGTGQRAEALKDAQDDDSLLCDIPVDIKTACIPVDHTQLSGPITTVPKDYSNDGKMPLDTPILAHHRADVHEKRITASLDVIKESTPSDMAKDDVRGLESGPPTRKHTEISDVVTEPFLQVVQLAQEYPMPKSLPSKAPTGQTIYRGGRVLTQTSSRNARDENPGPCHVNDLFARLSRSNQDPFRCVMIGHIPVYTSLADVVAAVHEGAIVSARLFRTKGMKTAPPLMTNTALITFVEGSSARRFVESCHQQPLDFSMSSRTIASPGELATVTLLPTASRPIDPVLLVKTQGGSVMTRKVYIRDPSHRFTASEIFRELYRCGRLKAPLRSDLDEVDGREVFVFEFVSIDQARAAYQMVLKNVDVFGEVETGFLQDPCQRGSGKSDLIEGMVARNASPGPDGVVQGREIDLDQEGKWKMLEG